MTTVFDADSRGSSDFDAHAWEGWAQIHGFDLNDVYRIEVLRSKVRIFQYKRDDEGHFYREGKGAARERARTIFPIFPVPV